MSIKGKAYIVGAYEHPLRKAPNHSVSQLHAEIAKAVQVPKMRDYLESGGYFPLASTPDDFKKFLLNDLKTLAELFRMANIKADRKSVV